MESSTVFFSRWKVSRTFLTGANPFVLKYEKLMDIAEMIHRYFPDMETISGQMVSILTPTKTG